MTQFRFALRTLMRTPVVSLVVVLSLGLGIGANTAIFSLFHQALLRALPVPEPDQLVLVNAPAEFKGGRSSTNNAGGMEAIFSYPMFRELEKQPAGLSGLAAHRLFGANLAYQGRTLDGSVSAVSGGFFQVLGMQPLLGRLIAPGDDKGAGEPAAVLSFGYWRDRLGGRSDVINQPLRVNGRIFTVVGVTPPGFTGITLGDQPDVFVPLVFKPDLTPGWNGTDRWDDYYLYLVGRLDTGVSITQAQAALNGVYGGLLETQASTIKGRNENYMQRFRASRLKLLPGSQGHSALRTAMETPLIILLICTALVLLIAAANAANLLLARAAQRTRELSIRNALGASRGQILRQLLAEALLLSTAGGLAGLIIGAWVLDFLLGMMGDGEQPVYFFTTSLDLNVLLFASAVTILTGFLFGLYPAWSASRSPVAANLKEDSSNASSSVAGARVRRVLVAAQVALSVLLLIPMGLFLKSLVNLLNVDLGLRTENLITFRISPELNGYKPDRSRQLFMRAEEELAAVPGVQGVTAAMVPLIGGSSWGNDITVEGFPTGPDVDNNSRFNIVGAGFFRQMGIPLLRGREFTQADTAAAPKVAVVTETWARHYLKDANPIGRKFAIGNSKTLDIEIVGLVKDSSYNNVRGDAPRLYYLPYRQQEDNGSLSFYVRSTLPTERLTSHVRRVMSSLDPDLPLEDLRTMQAQILRNIRGDRIVLQLASAFAILATVLAMLGLYGVTAFGVARRTREIGIRVALGAQSGRIRALVFREVALILVSGALFGVPAALALSRLAESQLFGVKAFDPAVIAGSLAALVLAALLAGFIPAWRASRIDPMKALRYE